MFYRNSAGTGGAEPISVTFQRWTVNGKKVDCGEEVRHRQYLLFSPVFSILSTNVSQKKKKKITLFFISIAFLTCLLAQNPCGVPVCLREAGGKERVWGEWKRKGMGRFSGESPARTGVKDAGDCNGTQESWGHTWETSATALPCPCSTPPLLRERMLARSPGNFKLRLRMTGEKQVETSGRI